MPTLHPLYIAINNYPKANHRLYGCVRDAETLQSFFKEYCKNSTIEYHDTELIKDEAATRQGIIDAFETSFKDVKDGDVCLLYYSGHGSRMDSPKEFWNTDLDYKMESLVCYDSRETGGRDLSDKELSYLIWKYSNGKKVHFLTIFDSCHSGSITRGEDVTHKMAEDNPTLTFAEQLEGYEHYQKQGDYLIPPSAAHIALSSCKSYESSVEMTIHNERRGLFTWALVETLKNNPIDKITYDELIGKINARIQNKYKNQHPLYNAYAGFNADQYFLSGAVAPKSKTFIYWDNNQSKWLLNQGAIQGIKDNTFVICEEGGKLQKTTVIKTLIGTAELQTEDWMDATKQYNTYYIENPETALSLKLTSSDNDVAKELLLNKIAQKYPNLWLVNAHQQYNIVIENNHLKLIKPNTIRPVFKNQKIHEDALESSINLFLDNVEKVQHWEHVSELSNPNAFLKLEEKVEIDFVEVTEHEDFEVASVTQSIDTNAIHDFVYPYNPMEKDWEQPTFSLKIKNNSNYTLWIGAVFLNEKYGITDNYMPLKEIAPQTESYKMHMHDDGYDYEILPLNFPDEIYDWGETEIRNQIKIFISTEKFQLNNLKQEDLQLQKRSTDKSATRGVGFKSLGFGSKKRKQKRDWTTIDLNFNIIKPTDGIPIHGKSSVSLNNNIEIEGIEGLNIEKIRLSNTNQTATKSLGNISPNLLLGSGFFKPFNLSEYISKGENSNYNVLELHGVKGAELVDKDAPLKMKINSSETHQIIPFAQDENGYLFPIGYIKNNIVHIEQLPNATDVITKGLGKSIKIYFSELYQTKVKKKKAVYPILAQVTFDEEGTYQAMPDTAKIKELVSKTATNRILIIIHGIIGENLDKADMVRQAKTTVDNQAQCVEDIYDLCLTFDYESIGTSIEDNAQLLKKRLSQVGLEESEGKTIHIIAHSMGGLISRYFLEVLGGDAIVSHLVQVGTPNLGSPLANVYDISSMALGKAINFLPIPAFVASVLKYMGKAIDQLEVTVNQLEEGAAITQLLKTTSIRIPYTIISGDTLLIPHYQDREAKLFQRILQRNKRPFQEQMNQYLFKGNSDSVVGLPSQKGLPDTQPELIHITEEIGSDHFSYFNTPAGLDKIAEVLFSL